MPKFNGVRDDDGFGVGVDDLKTAIVGEGRADVVAVSPAEAHEEHLLGLLWMSTGHPHGPREVASKLKGTLLKYSHADREGATQD